ncbi:hypothetical protein K1T71_010714 [Dendrolimus kikuchii]|uniref:Uncharacterized protein n=1 Tax=Dendrolimus kikuchii TaxID=765133 RepID=A0ACC1CPQ4_9NEOP|nr:hypothetical protein K1T71_010714 [Dendrolimus kikuchii]
MNTIILFEEYRFVERREPEISSAWKGAHLLLFFLAFVFGSFCTFCFHMLIYLFDEKCVLFPKLLSLTSMQHVYDIIPSDKDVANALPVDFVSTQWVDRSICYLPTFVPLVSGICGLVWTTMFLMCSSGSQTLTGLQHSWRVLPPVFIFSLAMGGLCIYSSSVTHAGLQALCLKLGELTNSTTCSYSINVATLVYERRIRGVYQAIKLTIITAWLHTACWILSSVITLVRVLLAVDFQLVKVSAELQGDTDKMLERHERHIRTISPDLWMGNTDEDNSESRGKYLHRTDIANIIYKNKRFKPTRPVGLSSLRKTPSDIIYVSKLHQDTSEMALVPSESSKLARLTALETMPKDMHFIISLLYDLLESLEIDSFSGSEIFESVSTLEEDDSDKMKLSHQVEHKQIDSKTTDIHKIQLQKPKDVGEATETASGRQRNLQNILNDQSVEIPMPSRATATNPEESIGIVHDSSTSISAEIRDVLEFQLNVELNNSDKKWIMKLKNKSNLKTVGIQTDKLKKKHRQRMVNITENNQTNSTGTQHESVENEERDKETQTHPKEKQD